MSQNEERSVSRRDFIAGSIVLGAFAAAVEPISAQTRIVTDSTGLIAGEVSIPGGDIEIPAYRAMPDTKGKKFPVVIVVHEIFGVHEWIQDVCRRFAKLGYMAIAPNLYKRQGDVAAIKEIRDVIGKVVSKVPDSQVMADLDKVVEYAKNSGSGNKKKVAITGFCWGGRVVWLYAAHNKKVKAGAAWYGRLVNAPNAKPDPLQPKAAIEFAEELKVPVIGLYGGLDTGIPVDSVQLMQDKLKKGKSKSEIIVFPNAGHGFLADYRPGFNKESAESAWKQTLEWFAKNGVK